MSSYQVMMTFEVPHLVLPRCWEITRPGRRMQLRVYGGSGRLAVQGTVREDSPADAAMAVVLAVNSGWDKKEGPIKLVSWSVHRSRVFAGLGRHPHTRSSSSLPGRGWYWDNGEGPDEGGSAGVREPRRPLPGPGSMSAELEIRRERG